MGCSPWLPADGHARGAQSPSQLPSATSQCQTGAELGVHARGFALPLCSSGAVPVPQHPRRFRSRSALTGGDFGECCNRHTDACTLLQAQEQLYKPQALLLCLEPVFPLKSIAQRTRERAGSPASPIVTRLTQPLQLQLFYLGTKQRCLQRDRALLPPTLARRAAFSARTWEEKTLQSVLYTTNKQMSSTTSATTMEFKENAALRLKTQPHGHPAFILWVKRWKYSGNIRPGLDSAGAWGSPSPQQVPWVLSHSCNVPIGVWGPPGAPHRVQPLPAFAGGGIFYLSPRDFTRI